MSDPTVGDLPVSDHPVSDRHVDGVDALGPSPLSPSGDVSEPKEGFEVGGDNSCDCAVPDLKLDKGSVGPWRCQVVWCDNCNHRFGCAMALEEESIDE